MYSYKCLQHVTILLYSTVFLDDDKVINKKVKKVLKEGLNPVLCIGETKEEYEAGLNREVCIHFVCSICKYICYVCILLVLVYMYTYIYVYIFYTVLCRIMYMRIQICATQLLKGLAGVTAEEMSRVVLACKLSVPDHCI